MKRIKILLYPIIYLISIQVTISRWFLQKLNQTNKNMLLHGFNGILLAILSCFVDTLS